MEQDDADVTDQDDAVVTALGDAFAKEATVTVKVEECMLSPTHT